MAATWRPPIFPDIALTVWNVDNGGVAVSEQGPVYGGPNFSPDSRRLALTRMDGNLLVYNLSEGRQISRWRMPYSGHVAFRPDGTQLAVLHYEPSGSTCKIVEAESGRLFDRSHCQAAQSWLRGAPMAPR